MDPLKKKYTGLDETGMEQLAGELASSLAAGTCVALYGDLGAGKTFLVRKICHSLGVDASLVRSPTFTLLNIYETSTLTVYHLDLYRLSDSDEVYDLGYDDIIAGGGIVFIEWPEKIEAMLPDLTIRIGLTIEEDGLRRAEIS